MKSQQTIAAKDLSELLALQDYYFVRSAYKSLLGREVDESGLNHFAGKLRRGEPKIQILMELRFSDEGRKRAVNMPGLDQGIRRHQRGKMPLLGWLFSLFGRVERGGLSARRLRVIEQQLFAHSDMTFQRINQLEAALASLPKLQAALVQPSVEVVAAAPEMPLAIPIPVVEPPKHLAPQAREAYFELKTALIKRTGRVA